MAAKAVKQTVEAFGSANVVASAGESVNQANEGTGPSNNSTRGITAAPAKIFNQTIAHPTVEAPGPTRPNITAETAAAAAEINNPDIEAPEPAEQSGANDRVTGEVPAMEVEEDDDTVESEDDVAAPVVTDAGVKNKRSEDSPETTERLAIELFDSENDEEKPNDAKKSKTGQHDRNVASVTRPPEPKSLH